MNRPLKWVIETAGSVTGNRFRLVVASSSVATAAIVGSALAGGSNMDLAAALLSRGLFGGAAPAATAPTTPVPTPAQAAPSGPSAGSPVSGTPVSGTPVAPTPTPVDPTPPDDTDDDTAPSRVKHIFVLSLASPGYEKSFGATSEMPYLSQTLRPQGQLLSGYSLLTNKGLPNSLAAISGQQPNALTSTNCPTFTPFPFTTTIDKQGFEPGNGCVYNNDVLTIADQLPAERLRWHAYMEDMSKPETQPTPPKAHSVQDPKNCFHPLPGEAETTQTSRPGNGYAVRHNPFVYFGSLLNLGACQKNDVPLDTLTTDLASTTATPNYVYISPNLCRSGAEEPCQDQSAEKGGSESADNFLKEWVPKILASPAYKADGVLIVTFGEAPDGADKKVGTLLVSKFLTPGTELPGAFTPYSLLRTTEELFGINRLAAANRTTTPTFATQLIGTTTTKKKKKKK